MVYNGRPIGQVAKYDVVKGDISFYNVGNFN